MTVRLLLVGGIGNQLFSFAFGEYLKLEYSLQLEYLVAPASRGNKKHLESSLKDFDLGVHILNMSRRTSIFLKTANVLRRSLRRFLPFIHNWLGVFYEEDFEGDLASVIKRIRSGNQNFYIGGYFQDKKYLDYLNCHQNVTLTPRNPSNWYFEQLATLNFKEYLAVHVRRGDFLQIGNALSSQYFIEAIEASSSHCNDTVVVFTDDEIQARELLGHSLRPRKITYISQPAGVTAAESLALLSSFRHLVISNSTFSWWAGYLGEGKQVVCPSEWSPGISTKDALLSENWQIVPSTWI